MAVELSDSAAAASSEESGLPPSAGTRLRCRWADGSVHVAEVVERRCAEGIKRRWYVHYVDLDRRLDEWVDESRFVDPRESLSQPQQAGMKRKRRPSSLAADNKDDDNNGRRLYHHGHGHDEHTKVRNIEFVQFDGFEIGCWYYSPYPGEYGRAARLYVCERSFKYFTCKSHFLAHRSRFTAAQAHPPGIEIYNDEERKLCVYEIDGHAQRLYCQNLCLFGKLFIEHKTLYYDPEPFLFYVLLEHDDRGFHPVGYFSKEKSSPEGYNLACILTLPPYQRKGYGKFIISLSYELSKLQRCCGSPEKPLSDLGKLSYRSFWSCKLLLLLRGGDQHTLQQMAEATAIKTEDILSTLQSLGFIKYFKGQYVIAVSQSAIEAKLEPFLRRNYAAKFAIPELCKLGWQPPKQAC